MSSAPQFFQSPRFSKPFKALGLSLLAATSLMAVQASAAAAEPSNTARVAPLTLSIINHGPASFHVNSVLVSGEKDAVLLDSGFTRADALRVAAAVLDSSKNLTTIYVSAADPDYYFGLEVLHAEFPDAKIVAAGPTLQKIQASAAGKRQFWGPKLGANAPRTPLLPALMTGRSLQVEGQTLEVRGLDDSLAHRSYVWIPSIKAVVGGVNIVGNVHAWTADTQSPAERAAWLAKLDAISALQPQIVVPGHMLAGTAQDASSLRFTREYLLRFERELPKARDAAGLIEAMHRAYPQAGLEIALDIGAKVNKGEMKW